MIDRRAFLATTALTVLAASRIGEARASTSFRVPRVGVLGEASPIPWIVRTPVVDIECRWADVERKTLADLASQLLALDVDVVVALGAASARAASRRTAHVPIVAVADADVGDDAALVTLAQSAHNVTRVSGPSEAGMAQQRLRILGQLRPRVRRAAVFFDPDCVASVRALAQLPGPALAPAVDVLALPARTVEDVERALGGPARDAVDGVLVLADTMLTGQVARLAELTAAARLPAACGAPAFTEAGGLLAVYGDTGELIRRTAIIVRRILAGETPATLSVPPRVAINVSAAKRLGVAVPSRLLARADVLATG